MHPQKLLALAASLGLSQKEIARHLGITHVQVARWSSGARPMPAKYADRVWDMVCEAFDNYMMSGKVTREDDPAQRGLSAVRFAPRDELIFHALRDLGLAHAELHGEGPSAWIGSVRVALEALPEDPRELRKPANTLRLLELSKQLADAAILLAKIGPLQDVMEDRTDANDNSQ